MLFLEQVCHIAGIHILSAALTGKHVLENIYS